MKQRFPKIMNLVVGTSGKWELQNRWVVAAFENGLDAWDWCDGCRRYGDWISQQEKLWLQDLHVADRDLEDYGDLKEHPLDQWSWAIEGTWAQRDAWEEEFDQQYPTGNFDYHRERELSLMMNPYDDKAFVNRDPYIKYEVVRVVLDPKEPYYADYKHQE